jgi:hypothetical protein
LTDGRGNCGGFHRCTALIITTRDKLFFKEPYIGYENFLVVEVVVVDFAVSSRWSAQDSKLDREKFPTNFHT